MQTRHVAFSALAFLPLTFALTRTARADDEPKNPWVERPLSLQMLHAEFQGGVGIGQAVDPVTKNTNVGAGANVEAAVGLPVFGELSVRTGYRFNDAGKAGGADYYGRLFDHETIRNFGVDAFSNPEVRLRGSIVDLEVFAIGTESRFSIPIADNTDFAFAPGIPIRFRIPHLARIDTGVFVPFVWTPIGDQTAMTWTISVPAQLWIQQKNWFFGPMTGIRYHHTTFPSLNLGPGVGTAVSFPPSTSMDITAGLGVGYTVDGFIDLKAQVYTDRINDSDWSKLLGAGVGVGLLIP